MLKLCLPWRRKLDNRAIAAVEFAICVPILLILFLGTLEILLLYRTSAKLNAVTASYAQMISLQVTSPISTGTPGLADLCQGIKEGLQPFPSGGLTLDVASVTQLTAAVAATQTTPAVPPTYGEWETDLNSSCTPLGTKVIGTTGANGAVTVATGNGHAANAMVQGAGDNMLIVRATLTYPGVLGVVLNAIPTLNQTSVARWRNASPTNISPNAITTPPTLEFLCTGTGCILSTCSSSTVCT